ncbi:hypothetical protein [Halobacteriovorax sp. YZS-1-1]|uniref:hypothetical protein n=1 Tax=unclassified Halobacteriovorax TaxID=2639665 RepID=UPI00399B9306
MLKNLNKAAILATLASTSFALPIDWHGELQTDMHSLGDYNRSVTQTPGAVTNGDQAFDIGDADPDSANFQTYIFKLQPTIIVNDSTTINAELTSGYGYGGNFGDSSNDGRTKTGTTDATTTGSFANARYSFNTVTSNEINLTQANAVFFSDTATYTVGRQKFNWGLGAVYNDGSDAGSRFASMRDGITIDFKIGNFKFSPYYSKIKANNLTKTGRIREMGISLLYENLDREFTFGALYNKNTSGGSTSVFADVDGDGTATELGSSSVTMIDLYFKKTFGKYTVEAEVPLMSGDMGEIYPGVTDTEVDAQAFLLNNTYKLNTNHSLHLDVGMVSGSEADNQTYGAMYLNPNFQVANIMFRYNLGAIGDTTQNVFNSSITNATYAKFAHRYDSGTWSWTNSVIWAKADQTATAGSDAINHEKNKRFTAAANQADDLGFEIDSNFSYKWNTSVSINTNIGYFFVGDYYAFSNTATPNETNDTYLIYIGADIKF